LNRAPAGASAEDAALIAGLKSSSRTRPSRKASLDVHGSDNTLTEDTIMESRKNEKPDAEQRLRQWFAESKRLSFS
jgi:hypothetical protein